MANAKTAIAKIAAQKLGIDTLETLGTDEQDFHDLSVACIKAALIAAYEAGRKSGGK